MRRAATVDDALADYAEASAAHDPHRLRRGMRRQRIAHIRERAGVHEVDLAAAVLLRRRADELDRDLERTRIGRGEQEGADVRHRDEVVATAMPDALERVVFGQKRDARSGRTDARAERGRKATDTYLDLVAVLA